MENRRYGSFSSVDNPQEFSKTIGSLLKIIGLVAGYVATSQGIHLAIQDINIEATVDAFALAGTATMAVWQFGEVLFGLVRKFVAK